jgi:hypothetical protein
LMASSKLVSEVALSSVTLATLMNICASLSGLAAYASFMAR